MSEKIIFEEKDNGAWIPRNYSPSWWSIPSEWFGGLYGGNLLLTDENLIFKKRNRKYDITIPLKKISSITIKTRISLPTLHLESVNGEYLAQFGSNKLEEWKMAIETQIGKITNRRVIREKQHQIERAKERERALDYEKQQQIDRAREREKVLDYDSAIRIWEKMGKPKEAGRVRKLKAEQGSVKVDQTVVHGDYVDDRDTIVKDSVISKSNVGAGGKTKGERIKLIKELLDSGAIDDDEFKQMKKEILGK
jgi:DNA-directed RNA polymerase